MKELSIEEKAKRYDEAIYIAKNINNEHRAQPFDVMTRIFPELKDTESEDEKTRKELYEFCMKCSRGDTLIIQHADFQRWATWLEKQGESKFEQCRQEGDKIVTNDDGTHFNVSQLERVAKKESTWSEEDENKVTLFMQLTEGCDNEDELADWLKSLKERIKPQWKPSEEQLKALNTMNVTGCITEVGQGKSLVELYEQLKKLREE